MPTNKKITFDKLDKKVIQQLPLLIDLISSTYIKIKSLFDNYCTNLDESLPKLVKEKHWTFDNRDYKNIFYPFTDDDYSTQTKIKNLMNCFFIESYYHIYKGSSIHQKKESVGIFFGHKYEDFTCSYFFIINRYLRKNGSLFNYKFYEKINRSIKEDFIKIEIAHPELGHKEEYIEIFCKDFDQDKINKTYEVFKNKVLIPYIKNLK